MQGVIYALDAPKKSEVMAAVIGHVISDEEIDIQLARLRPEQAEFMRLTAKIQGQWVEPPALEDQGVTVETTGTLQRSN